ncbi:MAG: Aldehyde dehydrogenase [Conexibacter sp.]|nr:Aldehyde dehydrogenase [Conexibacter sp.]
MNAITPARHDVRSPFTGVIVGSVAICGADEVDRACARASGALAARDFPQHRRAAVLEAAVPLLRERGEALAQTICAEAGKPITTARAEVDRCTETLTFAAAEARTLHAETIPYEASVHGAGRIGFGLRVPVGVVAAISPFNYPLNLVAHKLAPAIAAGCPVVLKPAPQTPLTALAFVALLVDAGLPEDWITVVTDAGTEAGAALVAHDVPALVTFTGSVDVGWRIAAAAPRKRVALELGSNAPLIVERDADPLVAARAIASAGFLFSGQNCISVQRVIVHRSLHAALLDALIPEVERLRVGDPADDATEVGPLIAPAHAERVRAWIDEAVDGGGRLLTGGERVGEALLTPAVVDGVGAGARLWRDEVFGPAVGVVAYDDFDEALALANDTTLRLQAGIFTEDLGRVMRALRELDFGGVHVNQVPTFRVDLAPYGGTADAGNTREGPRTAIREMTELRTVSLPA